MNCSASAMLWVRSSCLMAVMLVSLIGVGMRAGGAGIGAIAYRAEDRATVDRSICSRQILPPLERGKSRARLPFAPDQTVGFTKFRINALICAVRPWRKGGVR